MRKMPLNRIIEALVILSLICALPLAVSAQQKNYPGPYLNWRVWRLAMVITHY